MFASRSPYGREQKSGTNNGRLRVVKSGSDKRMAQKSKKQKLRLKGMKFASRVDTEVTFLHREAEREREREESMFNLVHLNSSPRFKLKNTHFLICRFFSAGN
jgi:hypothetical protein